MSKYIKAGLLSMALLAFNAQAAVCVLVGDSIAAGSGLSNGQARFSHILQVETNVEIRDLSSPGAALGAKDFSGFYRPDFVTQLNSIAGYFQYVNCIIVQAGTNDFGRSLPWQDSSNSLGEMLKWARANNKKVLLLLPTWRANEGVPNKLGYTLDTYRYLLAITCVHYYNDVCTFAHPQDSGIGAATRQKYYQKNEVSTGTELHLNEAGHRAMATWIKKSASKANIFH
jgi:lysophospholipase L1-like esterase